MHFCSLNCFCQELFMVHIFGHDPFKEWYLSQACRSRGCQYEFSILGRFGQSKLQRKNPHCPNKVCYLWGYFLVFSWPKWMKKMNSLSAQKVKGKSPGVPFYRITSHFTIQLIKEIWIFAPIQQRCWENLIMFCFEY